jgi:hypothetical protein
MMIWVKWGSNDDLGEMGKVMMIWVKWGSNDDLGEMGKYSFRAGYRLQY